MARESEGKNSEPTGASPPGVGAAPPSGTSPELTDWENRFKYLLADFDNFRRRTDRDRAGVRREAEADLLRRLIPVVEGFRQAEEAGKELPPTDALRRGLELLGREMDAVMESLGFAPVAEVGTPFRSEEHEAVGEAVGTNEAADGEIAEVVQQGYRFQGGLLRPAKVLVARALKRTDSPGTPSPSTAAGDDESPPPEERST